MNRITTVEEHIDNLSKQVKPIFLQLKKVINKAIPGGQECISYQIPAIKLDGKTVIYFAGWKNHVSLYPIPAGNEDFEKEIAPYVAGKGTLKFDIKRPIPYDLIKKIISISLEACLARAKK